MATVLAIKKNQGKAAFKRYRRKKFQLISFRSIRKIIIEYSKEI